MSVSIRIGSFDDYAALARFHYRAAKPATICRTLVALASLPMNGSAGSTPADPSRATHDQPIAGVLTISRPALNGPWRSLAWPDFFDPRDIARLNTHLRVISRVIVDPRFRGLGIGRALVRAYLDAPLTTHTEALTAMGRYSGVFTGAGMRPIDYPPARRIQSLTRTLTALHIKPWQLADPDLVIARLTRSARSSLDHALRVFAGAHRDTRALQHAPLRTLITTAARRIATRPIAYVKVTGVPSSPSQREGAGGTVTGCPCAPG